MPRHAVLFMLLISSSLFAQTHFDGTWRMRMNTVGKDLRSTVSLSLIAEDAFEETDKRDGKISDCFPNDSFERRRNHESRVHRQAAWRHDDLRC
jgi:hypothetical protein